MLRVFGRARIAGQVIWAANFKETITEDTQTGKGGRLGTQTTTVSYLYSISLAIGLCEGNINRIGRIWADGKPLDVSQTNMRFYKGNEDQSPDHLIALVEGDGNTPAFRGLAYVVFEDLPLTEFGNRIPQFSFEVEQALDDGSNNSLETQARAVTLIPGSGEFVYGTTPVLRKLAEGAYQPENTHSFEGPTDFIASLDALTETLPNLQHIALVISWFGNDLRVGHCQLEPRVELIDKETEPYSWQVSGLDRASAQVVSFSNDRPNFGGTPADRCVIEALQAIHAKGLSVMIHPFILMDIPHGNTLPTPEGDVGGQPAFPWRGRIRAGNLDGTPSATQAVEAFFGHAQPSDFSSSGDTVSYTGPAEWSFRRMILHLATLCQAAGVPVGSFLLGSELRGITTIRDANGAYPAISHLRYLAQDVRSIFGSETKLSYGADWNEYFGHQPENQSGDRLFHLDDFWADANVDFIGIDNYMPLSDWRPGFAHLDSLEHSEVNSVNGPYSLGYLQSNIRGGEGYDWFYASQNDRDNQTRTPIMDSFHGEEWIYRYKDLWNWWSQSHHERIAGQRQAISTPWVPASKPIRFTELGCPAVNNGAVQPNVFVDAKSVESALPYYSNGQRDDLAQRRFLEAHADFWQKPENNPSATLYAGRMVEFAHSYLYAWDARPYPDFPARDNIWGDAANWATGHWLNGRLGRTPLDQLVAALAAEVGFFDVETEQLVGILTGYVVDRPLSPREMIDPLANVFQFDMIEVGQKLRFQSRINMREPSLMVTPDHMVERGEVNAVIDVGTATSSPFTQTIAQIHDLPSILKFGFFDEGHDFQPGLVEARDPALTSSREVITELPIVLNTTDADATVRKLLADAWSMRTQIEFSLPLSTLALAPGDLIHVDVLTNDESLADIYRIIEIEDTDQRRVEAVRIEPSVFEGPVAAPVFQRPPVRNDIPIPPDCALLDIPLLPGENDGARLFFAGFASPWPGGLAVYRQTDNQNLLAGIADVPAQMGFLVDSLPPGESGRWHYQRCRLSLNRGGLASATLFDVLSGVNAIAVQNVAGRYEILQFREATPVSANIWEISTLLRGQSGTEAEAMLGAASGARVVVLSSAQKSSLAPGVLPMTTQLDWVGATIEWRAGSVSVLPSDVTYREHIERFEGRGLRPLSPVHFFAHRQQGGVSLCWIRRTRFGGDSWLLEEVPLGENGERYRLDFLAGSQTVRSVETMVPNYIYTDEARQEDENTHGLAAGAPLSVIVRQVSGEVGPGEPSEPLILPS